MSFPKKYVDKHEVVHRVYNVFISFLSHVVLDMWNI